MLTYLLDDFRQVFPRDNNVAPLCAHFFIGDFLGGCNNIGMLIHQYFGNIFICESKNFLRAFPRPQTAPRAEYHEGHPGVGIALVQLVQRNPVMLFAYLSQLQFRVHPILVVVIEGAFNPGVRAGVEIRVDAIFMIQYITQLLAMNIEVAFEIGINQYII